MSASEDLIAEWDAQNDCHDPEATVRAGEALRVALEETIQTARVNYGLYKSAEDDLNRLGGFQVAVAERTTIPRAIKTDLTDRLNRFICAGWGHRFAGWASAGSKPGHPLPMVHCERCDCEI